ncbi:MAG: DUF624 domain-containing protein [Lachnospiraceae bacterium]|nr:DUF624 domain-containing protein [Lachnospiraceae bacterium]
MKLKKNTTPSTSGNSKKPTRLGEMLTDGLLTLVIWNVLFLLTCIPIITIGPAMAALGFCTNSLVIDERPQKNAAKVYFSAFRASFFKALPIGIYFLFITILFGAGFFVYSYLSPENAAYVSMSSLSLVILTLFWGVMAHLYPLLFEFEQTDWEKKQVVMTKKKLRELISEAAYTAMARMKQTAIALVFSVLFFGSLILFLPATLPLIVTIGFSFVAVAMALAHTSPEY